MTSHDIIAYLIMWTLVIWVCSHKVSMRSHFDSAYIAIGRKVESIMNQTHKIVDSVMSNRALLCAWVVKNVSSENRPHNVILKDNYYLMQNVKGMNDESAITWLENVESVISQLYLCESTLKGDKRKERLAWLATQIRETYKTTQRIPAWVDSLLAVGNLDSYTGSDQTIASIGATIASGIKPYAPESPKKPVVDKNQTIVESAHGSPVEFNQLCLLAGKRLDAKKVGAKGQAFSMWDESLYSKLAVGKSFELDNVDGYKWVCTSLDKDSGTVYATWSHKQATPTMPATTTPTMPATKSRKGSKATQPTDTDSRIATLESGMNDIKTLLMALANKA